MPRQITTTIELTSNADKLVRAIAAEKGMVKRELISRILEWFAEQTPTIQSAIIGAIPQEVAPDIARIVLERMAAGNNPLGRDSTIGRGAVVPPAEELKKKK